jgi:ferritin
MKLIQKLSDMIEDELEGAEDYAKMALKLKEERPEMARTFNMMASQEMEHMNNLHKMVVDVIDKYRMEKGEPPAAMLAVYDYLHEKHIEKAAEVRTMINMFA